MHATEFLKAARSQEIPPVLLLAGEDRMLHQMVVDRLSRRLSAEGAEDVGVERHDGGDTPLNHILESAATGSLFSAHRIVLLRNAEAVKAPSGSPELAALGRYLESPNDAVTLVLSAGSVNRTHQPFKLLFQEATVIDCSPLKGPALRSWISSYLRDRGYTTHPAGVALVEELLGANLLLVSNALEKVMLYCGERHNIEYEDIEKALNSFREHALWELTNAIGARDAAAALSKLTLLLDEGKHPLQATAALQNQFRQLMIVRDLMDKRLARQEVISRAGIRFRPDRILDQARQFGARDLRWIHRKLFDLENKIKSAGPDERYLLEDFIISVCSKKAVKSMAARSSS